MTEAINIAGLVVAAVGCYVIVWATVVGWIMIREDRKK